jgi:hypothetical protein
MFVTNKSTIVNTILQLLPEDQTESPETAMKTWWTNIRLTGGLGLTEHGDAMFRLAEIECHDFEIQRNPDIGILFTSLMLNRELECPHFSYYTKYKRYIRIYDSRIAMLIALTGDIYLYLSRVKNRKNND